jgi:SAM domain (Sterile alpha motif)
MARELKNWLGSLGLGHYTEAYSNAPVSAAAGIARA